jgi:hypothetical protein
MRRRAQASERRVPQEMPGGKKEHVSFDRSDTCYNSVCAHSDVVRRFSTGTAVSKERPSRTLFVNVNCQATFILAIIPLKQITIDFSHRSKAGRFVRMSEALPIGYLARRGKPHGRFRANTPE